MDGRYLEEITLSEAEALVARKRQEALASDLRAIARALERGEHRSPGPGLALAGGSGRTGGFAGCYLRPMARATSSRATIHKAQGRPYGKGLRQAVDTLLLAVEVAALIALLALVAEAYTGGEALGDRLVPEGQSPLALASEAREEAFLPRAEAGAVELQAPEPRPQEGRAATLSQRSLAPEPPTRIVIPAIGVDSAIVPGDSWQELKRGVGHRPGSARLGEVGNLVLSGHNDVYGQVFRRLEELKPGDEILIFGQNWPWRYLVTETRILSPKDLGVLQPASQAVVTLITCHPYRVDTHRLVVTGRLAQD
ncbi:MAG: sortase [Chloroflexota bacterium]